jgi:hypothetical protein
MKFCTTKIEWQSDRMKFCHAPWQTHPESRDPSLLEESGCDGSQIRRLGLNDATPAIPLWYSVTTALQSLQLRMQFQSYVLFCPSFPWSKEFLEQSVLVACCRPGAQELVLGCGIIGHWLEVDTLAKPSCIAICFVLEELVLEICLLQRRKHSGNKRCCRSLLKFQARFSNLVC